MGPLLAGGFVVRQQLRQALVGADDHAAEFQTGKAPAVQADPYLRIDRTAAVLNEDQQGDQKHQGQEEDQRRRCGHHIQDTPAEFSLTGLLLCSGSAGPRAHRRNVDGLAVKHTHTQPLKRWTIANIAPHKTPNRRKIRPVAARRRSLAPAWRTRLARDMPSADTDASA